MSLTTSTARVDYTGTGALSEFDYPFLILDEADLEVTRTVTATGVESTLTLTTDYTVDGVGDDAGGTITLVGGVLASGYTLTIRRRPEITQPADIRNQGPYFPETIEDALDRNVMIDQRQQEELDRCLKLPASEDVDPDFILPSATDRASNYLAFDSDGNPVASSGGISASVPVSAFMETVLDDTSASAARATLGVNSTARSVKDAAYGAVGDGTTNDTAAINLAISTLSGGGEVYFPPGTYKCTTGLVCAVANVRLRGEGRASKIVLPDGQKISVTASGFSMSDLWVDGTLYSTHTSTSRLVSVTGADSANYLTNTRIERCFFTNAPMYGIYAEFVSGIEITDNFVDTVSYAGIALHSASHFTVSRNTISNINLDEYQSNAYGIYASQNVISSKTGTISSGSNSITSMSNVTSLSVGMIVTNTNLPVGTRITGISGTTLTVSNLATGTSVGATINFGQPVSEHGVISDNTVRENPIWEAIDTHSGKNISITGNTVIDCFYGINAGYTSQLHMAPKNIVISGNTLRGYNGEDSTKTVTGTGTAMVMSAAPEFTVRVGNYLTVGSETKRITVVTNQTNYTIASAFSSDPSAAACTVTQKGSSASAMVLAGYETAVGAPIDPAENCVISGNAIYGWGDENLTSGNAIYLNCVKGVTISGNSLVECNGYAIYPTYDCYGVSIVANTIVDPWSYTKTVPSCIRVEDDYVTLLVAGNYFQRGTKTATYVLIRGINLTTAPLTHSTIRLGENVWEGATAANFAVNIPTAMFTNSINRHPQRFMSTAVPSVGTWNTGDVVWKSDVDATSVIGWICSVAGTPGTWRELYANGGTITSLVVGSGGTALTKIVKGQVTFNPASVSANSYSSQSITISGATANDTVILNPPTAGLSADMIIASVCVTAADTVTIVFYNPTAGAVDLASGSWTYTLIRS